MQENNVNKRISYWGMWKDYKPPTVDKLTGDKICLAYHNGGTWAEMCRDFKLNKDQFSYILRTLGILPEFAKKRTTAERRRTAYRARARKHYESILMDWSGGKTSIELAKQYSIPEKYILELLQANSDV